ncbi:hypothetical protein [uncultured Ferrimonas sp.]|uniref:hypothetical protein n=1 Tax=uncultured Ferrimonas sp. TaxID=432640 RepID=UPI002630134F|nr:hypothetical protein [uncultured Ferrimonas sp.]
MSSSLKKLKKLKKIAQPVANPLAAMAHASLGSAGATRAGGSAVSAELKQISRQAGLDVVRELATPLNPLLSWFEEGANLRFVAANETALEPRAAATMAAPAAQSNIARLPLKSPPCKRCPAKMGGLCKCAQKRFG